MNSRYNLVETEREAARPGTEILGVAPMVAAWLSKEG
jgi:hypothetical protein